MTSEQLEAIEAKYKEMKDWGSKLGLNIDKQQFMQVRFGQCSNILW